MHQAEATTKVLVTAASKHGSTGEIAGAIGDALTARGLEVEVMPPERVAGVDAYDAVVLGSAVYAGRWLPAASSLANRVAEDLAKKPVWLFSSGPVGNPSRKLVQKMGADPVDAEKVSRATGAREHRVFAGKLDRRNVSFLQRVALMLVRGLEGDFRDWEKINTWALQIADALLAPPSAEGHSH